jgi:hypothetical protein
MIPVPTLDRAREAEHVEARLATAERRDDPFPFVWVEELLSPGLYALLDRSWPEVEQFPPEERANRRDMVPRPPATNPADSRASGYDRLPASMRAVWDFFVIEINRGIVGPWLAATFRDAIETRLALIEDAWRSGRAGKDYYQPPYVPQMNVGRLMMRAQGFRLSPHADALPYLATALYYFPSGGDPDEFGTTLYGVSRPLDPDAIVADARTMYFRDAGIETTPVFHAPFRRNALLAFVNGPTSAHGMTIATPGVWRRAYQSHLSIKSDHHHL